MVLLLTPPFDHTALEPGYIKGYVPGVRENGAQYTHGAAWAVIAFAELGDGDKAAELLAMLNPITHSATPAAAERYRVEPYVSAGDVYSAAAHVGRGGWTWYSGSAGWLYRAGVEWLLGVRQRGTRLLIDPCIPGGMAGIHGQDAFSFDPLRDRRGEPGTGLPRCDTARTRRRQHGRPHPAFRSWTTGGPSGSRGHGRRMKISPLAGHLAPDGHAPRRLQAGDCVLHGHARSIGAR